jgi:two-component system, cell cycle response regulator
MADSEQDMQVLVVDDSRVYLKLVSDALYYQPYSVLVAQTGREAMDILAQQAPPIVITDWLLPDVSGLQLCEWIRSNAPKGYTYVILLTSMSDKENIVKGLEAGADDYLTKPFDPDELKARLGAGRRIVGLCREIEVLTRQIEQSARVDPITGLPNGRAVEEWATRQLKGAIRHGFPVWAVLADVDCIQRISETCGRDAGNTVLKEFAQILRDTSETSDICGRLDGGEFVSVLTHVGQADVEAIVERYRRCLEEHKFSFHKEIGPVTASFGAAGLEGMVAPDFPSLVLKAENALSAARSAGGNSIRIQS